jgi:hypothetical protein
MENMFEGMRDVVDPVVLSVGVESPGSQIALGCVMFGLAVTAVLFAAQMLGTLRK